MNPQGAYMKAIMKAVQKYKVGTAKNKIPKCAECKIAEFPEHYFDGSKYCKSCYDHIIAWCDNPDCDNYQHRRFFTRAIICIKYDDGNKILVDGFLCDECVGVERCEECERTFPKGSHDFKIVGEDEVKVCMSCL